MNPDNIRAFLKNNGYYPSEDEVIAVVRRLDTDADCKVSYAEFCEAIKSQEFTKLKETLHSSPNKDIRENPLSS
jgi:Ca2+-binding EF-hand superfamily protein